MPPDELTLPGSFGGVLALLVVYGACTGLPLAVAGLALVRALRLRVVASRARSPDDAGPLARGDGIVSGTIEYDGDAAHAVRVVIEQDGTERKTKGSWTHTWTQTRRTADVRPFYLRLASGARLRVEPDVDVQLTGDMSASDVVESARRTRTTELTAGQRVFARGQLVATAPHDEGAPELSLVPPKGGELLISAAPLGESLERRAAFHLRWVALLAFSVLASQPLLFGFHRDVLAGRAVVGNIVSKQLIFGGDGVSPDAWSPLVLAEPVRPVPRTTAPRTLIVEVSKAEYDRIDTGQRVWLRVVAGAPRSAHFGRTPRCDREWLLVSLLSLLGVALYLVRARRVSPPRTRALVESGVGRLPSAT